MTGFCSFNLCKNGGTIRLIFTVNKDKNLVIIKYISMDHYKDFKRKIKED